MPVTRDILQTWRDPRGVFRRLLAQGPREDRAIAYLMVACLLVFVAQWPRLVRLSAGEAAAGSGAGLDRLMAYEAMGWLMVWPLVLYALAAVGFVVARGLRMSVSGHDARLALFWALLAASPAMLLYGLLRGFNGEVPATHLAGVLWIAAVLVFWGQGLREGSRQRQPTSL